MTSAGFPHSDIHGSLPACGSPWLFAACHVLLRRLVPWHPPCALISLIFSSLFVLRPIVLCFTTRALALVCNWPFRSNLSSLCSCQGARFRYSVFRPNPENDTEFFKTLRQLTCMTHVFHVHARAPTLSCCSGSFSVSKLSTRFRALPASLPIDLG